MAGAPPYKIFVNDEYQASLKDLVHCAMLVSAIGDGAEIRYGHGKKWRLWTEGLESQSAHESYEFCAEVCLERLEILQREAHNTRRVISGSDGKPVANK